MGYILDQYTNMRGTHFVKHLKGTRKGSIDTLMESQVTRTKFANIVASTKIIDKAVNLEDKDRKERKLWVDAKKYVLEFHANDDCNKLI